MLKTDLLMPCFPDQRGGFLTLDPPLQSFCRRVVKSDWSEQRDPSQLSGSLKKRLMLNVTFYAAISQASRKNGAYVRVGICFSFCRDAHSQR